MFQKQYILNEGSLKKEEKNGCTIIYKNGFPDDVIDKSGVSSRKLYGFPNDKDECVIQDFDGIIVVSDNNENGGSIKGDGYYKRFWRGLVLFPSGTMRYFPTLVGVRTNRITEKYRRFIGTIGKDGQHMKNLFTDEGFPMYGQEQFNENKPILPDEQGWVRYIYMVGNADNKDVTAFISTDDSSPTLDGLNIDGKTISFDEDVDAVLIIKLPDSEPLIQLENGSLSKIIDFTGRDICQGWGKLDRIEVRSDTGKLDLKPHVQEFFTLTDDNKVFQIFRTYPKVEDIKGLYHAITVNTQNSSAWVVEKTQNRGKNILSPRHGEDFIFNEFVDDIYYNNHKSSEFYVLGCFLVRGKDGKINLVEYKTLKPVLDKFAIDIKILFNPISPTYPYTYIVAKFDNNIEFYSSTYFDKINVPDNITDVMTDEENHIFFTLNGKPRLLIGSASHTPYIECNMCLNTYYGYLLQVPNGYKYLFNGSLSETFDGIYDIESLFPIVERSGKFNYLDIPNGDVVFKNTWFDDCDPYEGSDMYNVEKGYDFTVTVNGKQEKIHFQQRNNFSIA